MSFRPVLPDLADDEIVAICDMIGNANVDVADLGSLACTRHRFARDLAYADEGSVAGRYEVDIQTLIERVLDWHDAEFAGAITMVALFCQRWPIFGRDEILAEIRAELSPTAHQCLCHAQRLRELRANRGFPAGP